MYLLKGSVETLDVDDRDSLGVILGKELVTDLEVVLNF